MLDTVISLGWGALALTREKTEKVLQEIAAKGKTGGKNSRSLIHSLAERGVKERAAFKENFSNKIGGLLQKSNLVSKTEFTELENRLKTLEELIKKDNGETPSDGGR
ncbi:MAG: phasin family protein [Dethiobacteria bacterium]|jgi:polyhydroxyalkanoate synthesis regulator phasin